MRPSAYSVFKFLSINNGRLDQPVVIQDLLQRIRDCQDLNEIDLMVQDAAGLARSLGGADIWAYTKALAACGFLMDDRGLTEQAALYLSMAVKQGGNHGREFIDLGPLYWVLGHLQYKLRLNDTASESWRLAIDKLTIQLAMIRDQEGALAIRIRHVLRWMNDHKFSTLEEIFEYYLDWFEGHQMGTFFAQTGNKLKNMLEARQYEEADALIKRLDEYMWWVQNRQEQILIQVRLGMAYWQMGNTGQALERLNHAVSSYKLTHRHQEAMARWMLGICEWQMPVSGEDAAIQWDLAYETFTELLYEANVHNEQEQINFYTDILECMRRLILERHHGAEMF